MPTKDYYFEQIANEFAMGREAERIGNMGMARVCARRAAGQAIGWFLTKHSRPTWGSHFMRGLNGLKDDNAFPQEARDAAVRLTTHITDQFKYPFSSDPLADAQIIIDAIKQLMGASE
ncbi:MAG TPA: hypothetical protein VKS81_00460 [Bacteroidota bacterium]|nr:hypothetical protein [Bacteroidota bacterium]